MQSVLTSLAVFLQTLFDPLVLIAPLVIGAATGRRLPIRLGTAALGGLMAWLGPVAAPATILGPWLAPALGVAAGLAAAEIWLQLIWPVWAWARESARRLRAWFGGA